MMAEARDLPLFRWGEELRRARSKRARLRWRGALIGVGLACLAATIIAPPVPRLLWNASASAPLGLYWVRPGASAGVGDLVVAWPPRSAGLLAAQRHYLPSRVPLVKRVVAVSGAAVCAKGAGVFVDESVVFPRRRADSVGRPLPWWEGCRRLRPGEIFLLMAEAPDSFDGRYFGVTKGADVVGKAVLLWRR
jgi:conjugative transfer signal peptidase TraF